MSHHHHHHHKDHTHCSCCGQVCEECTCCCHDTSSCQDSSHHHHHEHQDFSQTLLELADEAWMEVLYEKIKAKVESSSGKNLDKLAQIVAESNQERWKHKLAGQKVGGDFHTKVSEFFNKK